MKQFFTLLSVMLGCACLWAQKPQVFTHSASASLHAEGTIANFLLKTSGGQDTLRSYVDRATGFTIQGVTTGGYVYGTNSNGQGDKITSATGLHFDAPGLVNLDEFWVWFAFKETVGAPDNLAYGLWTAGIPDSTPNMQLANGLANVAFIDTNVQVNFATGLGLNRFLFSSGSTVINNEPFLLVLDYLGMDDTLGLVSSADGDGMGERRAKQYDVSFQAWLPAALIWNGGVNNDPVMFPVVTPSVGQDDPVLGNQHFTVRPPYPNPVDKTARLEVNLPYDTHLQVIVWDVGGRLLYDSGNAWQQSGQHQFEIDVSEIPAGSYYYSVRTDANTIHSKLSILH